MRKLLSAVLLLCASVCAFGQGATVLFPPAVTSQGNFLPFATITFCSTPTTVNTLGVCQTPVTVFKDQALTQPYSSAIQTDGIGYFPPNANTATSLWFSPAANLCFTLTTTNMLSPATNPCTPFTLGVQIGSSPSFTNLTVTANETVTNVNGIQVAGNGGNTTIQAAITAAGTTGAVEIPPGYAGTDSYSNTNGVPVIDYRPNNNGVAIWSVLQPSAPVANFPLGNDLAIHAAGPGDIHLRNRDLQVTSSTSCTAATPCTVTVASPTLYGSAISGNATAKFSTSAGIVIEPGTANQETVGAFTIASGNQLTFTPTLNHAQPYKIRQQGNISLDGSTLHPTADATGQLKFFSIDDANLSIWMNLPIQNGAFPLNAPQQVAIVTGGNGANSDLVWRMNNSSSVFKVLNAANNATPVQVDNSGNLSAIGQFQTGSAIAGGGGLNAPALIKATSQTGIALDALNNGADLKIWDIFHGGGGSLQIRAVNDANNAASTAIQFSRSSGTTIDDVTINQKLIQATANGAQWIQGQASENLTLSTGGTTTDTSANLLPANSIIEAVVARVTTTITTATDWKLGDGTTAGRFAAANSVMTSGSTSIGTVQADQTGAAGPRQASAAKVRVTTTGTPGAGAIRITVFYRQFVAPTS